MKKKLLKTNCKAVIICPDDKELRTQKPLYIDWLHQEIDGINVIE